MKFPFVNQSVTRHQKNGNSAVNQSFLEEIKERLSIQDVINHYGLQLGRNNKILSIYKEEKTPSLHFDFKKNNFYCYSTGRGGDPLRFIQDYEKLEFKEAIAVAAKILGLTPPPHTTRTTRTSKSRKDTTNTPKVTTKVTTNTPKVTTKVTNTTPKVTNHIPEFKRISPIVDLTRASKEYDRQVTEYQYSPTQKIHRVETSGKKQFYCYHLATGGDWQKGKGQDFWPPYPFFELPETKYLIVCEGEKDTLSCLEHGVPAATPPGHSFKEDYLEEMAGWLRDRGVVALALWPDNDDAGYSKAEKLKKACTGAGLGVKILDPEKIFEGFKLDKGYGAHDYFEQDGCADRLIRIIGATPWDATDSVASDSPNSVADNIALKKIENIDAIATDFCAENTDKILFDRLQKEFFEYTGKNWVLLDELDLKTRVRDFLVGNNYFINSTRKILEVIELCKLNLLQNIDDGAIYLGFLDGVLDLQTLEFHTHSPSFKNLCLLRRNYVCDGTETPTVDRFLSQLTNNNTQKILQLKAFMAASLRGVNEHQKFLHLLGSAGSGKGTFLRLLTQMLGTDNVHSSNLSAIESPFEGSNMIRKKVTIFPDEHRTGGNLSRFLSITGGDFIRVEEKYKKAYSARYSGLVAIASNFEIFVTDAADAVLRRRILVSCNFKPETPDFKLDEKLQAELPQLTQQLLQTPKDEILSRLQTVAKDDTDWNLRIRINSVAAWLEECCQFDPQSKSVIGRNKDELDPVTLYASYGAFCRGAGFQPRSLNNFSQDVIDTAKTFFSVELLKTRTNTTRFLSGVRLVTTSDSSVTTSDSLRDNLKPLPHKDSDNRDNLFPKDSSKEVLSESQLSGSKDSTESLENNFWEEVVTAVTDNSQTLASTGIEASDNLGNRLSLSCHEVTSGCHEPDSVEPDDQWLTLYGGSRQVKILRRDEYRSLVRFRDDGSQKMIYNYLIDE